MRINNPIKEIAKKEFDRDYFVERVIQEKEVRDLVIHEMLNNEDIMVYYHCYYVIEEASKKRPELFYSYWDQFRSLLDHKNSYLRNMGLTIMATLTPVDDQDRFSEVFEKYMTLMNDEKFMTAQCCIKNLKKIIKQKGHLEEDILEALLDIDSLCSYPHKQKELLKGDILEVFDQVYQGCKRKSEIKVLLKKALSSVSPKTRKRAMDFVEKYQIEI
ncbi:MAG: hypothetical protein D5R97_07800 [Candidatus Syntrophonatronum acetioxidans]|uniref:HEAT repeat domain-containing protein n=1 Tax=Candidatus Syntrophonatronum acetioxidans TaxID=1795816 RepID=A0A424YBR5_9FIRM|nr:MAG: hypothetical protein D5R97_07800 [Candidatus Syntrophonatronum acetioxidans]